MNDNNAPHYTELPIAQLEENKGQIDGLPANPRNIQPDKLRAYTILDNSSMGEWNWQALQLDTTRASLHRTISLALTQRTHRSCVPTWGDSSRFDTTDARPCVLTTVTRLISVSPEEVGNCSVEAFHSPRRRGEILRDL